MKEKKRREDYPDDYAFRADTLWREVISDDDICYPKIISFFVKSGNTLITGREVVPKQIEFVKEVCIKAEFQQMKALMTTKSGKLRASMQNLTPYQEYTLIALLNHLREAWSDNEETVFLSWQEFYLLKEGGFNKNKPKNSKKKINNMLTY